MHINVTSKCKFRFRGVVLATLFIISGLGLQAQQKGGGASILSIERNTRDQTPKAIVFTSGAGLKATDAQSLFREYLGIGDGENKMIFKNTTKTKQNTVIDRYEQYYKGIKIERSSYTIASKDGMVSFMNGNAYKIKAGLSATPALSSNAAFNKALAKVGAQKYMWQDPAAEQFIKTKTHNPNATYLPKGSLVWIEDCSTEEPDGKLHLAYCFDVYAQQPVSRNMIYVDAVTGKILFMNSRIKSTAATGVSLYSGNLPMQTAYTGGQYVLYDSTRGNGIYTVNLHNTTNYGSWIDFTNATTTWGSEASHDAHWGAEIVYDYWSTVQGRLSFDNANGEIDNYVHYGTNYDNAYWDGTEMTYGDGSGIQNGGFSPLVSLDVCAHEIGHGVCEYTCNLDYMGESGGMNEGFSDCWGATIENWGDPHLVLPDNKSTWLIGEEIGSTALRSMANPLLHGQPNTYHGQYWYTTTGCVPSGNNDECGVHTNSGVLNHWYYLLCVGGSGTNGIGNAYSVTGIGLTEGANILYQTELVLAHNAQYADCRTASINVATLLYGPCSPELIAVTKAWYAVGVGANYTAPATPGTPVIAGATSICSGLTTIYSVTPVAGANSYTWTVTGTGWSGSSTTNSISATVGTGIGTLTCRAVNSCGVSGPVASYTVTPSLSPAAATAINGPASYCTGSVITFTTPVIANATSYAWTVTGTGWSGTSATNSINVTVGTGNGTITVHGVNGTCGSGTTFSLTNLAPGVTPSAAIINTVSTCPGAIVVYTASSVGATSYTWTVAGTGWSGTSTTNSIILTAGTGTGTITCRGISSCGSGSITTATVTPGTLPAVATSINAPALICTGNVAVFDVSPIGNSTSYQWTVNGTGWSGTSATNVLTANVGSGIGSITIQGVNNCGAGPSYTLNNIVPSSIPAKPVINPQVAPCTGSTALYTVNAVTGATSYLWEVFGSGWSGLSFTSDITVTAGTGTAMLISLAQNSCGMSSPDTAFVTATAVPAADTNITRSALICSGDTASFTTSVVPNATSYVWTVTGTGWSGSGTTAANTLVATAGSGPATISVAGVNACGTGTPFSISNVNVQPTPTATFTVTDHTIYNYITDHITYAGNAPVGSTYTWNFDSGTATPGTGGGPQTVTWSTPGWKHVTLSVTSGGCTSNVYMDSVQVLYSALGIANTELKDNISISPNPNDGKFDILFSAPVNEKFAVRLSDMQGKVLYSTELEFTAGKASVSARELPDGVYIAAINVHGNIINKKVIITR